MVDVLSPEISRIHMRPLFQTYCHQTPRQAPAALPSSRTEVAGIAPGRLRHYPAGSSRLSKPNRVHLSLRSIWFFPLLPTPPRGDAVTSSYRRHNGYQRPRSRTLKEDAALQRTGQERLAPPIGCHLVSPRKDPDMSLPRKTGDMLC